MQSKSGKTFKEGDRIEVDLLTVTRNDYGVYAQLADKSGWIPARDEEGTKIAPVSVRVFEVPSFGDTISKVLYATGIPDELNEELLPYIHHPNRSPDETYKRFLKYPSSALARGEGGAFVVDDPRMKQFRLKFLLEKDMKFTLENLQFDNFK